MSWLWIAPPVLIVCGALVLRHGAQRTDAVARRAREVVTALRQVAEEAAAIGPDAGPADPPAAPGGSRSRR